MAVEFGHTVNAAALRSDIATAEATGAGLCWPCLSGRHGECTGVECWGCPPENHRRDGWPHIVTDVGGHE